MSRYTHKCQVCGRAPCGMVRWPEPEDDYICIDCLRKEFKELQIQLQDAQLDK
jgi:hypothetical protein